MKALVCLYGSLRRGGMSLYRARTYARGPLDDAQGPLNSGSAHHSALPFPAHHVYMTPAPPVSLARVRLYQDSTFCKRPGDGPTRWHSDLNMAPLDCNDFVTAWIPVEAVPARKDGGSPLVFASRSVVPAFF